MSHSQSIFPNILAIPRPPFPPPLGSNVVVCSKATLILRHFVGNNFDLWGGGVWYRKSVVVEIVLLRSILHMKGYKFSSSFVRDCSTVYETFWSFQTKLLGSIKSFKVLFGNGTLEVDGRNQPISRKIFERGIKGFVCRFKHFIPENGKRLPLRRTRQNSVEPRTNCFRSVTTVGFSLYVSGFYVKKVLTG